MFTRVIPIFMVYTIPLYYPPYYLNIIVNSTMIFEIKLYPYIF